MSLPDRELPPESLPSPAMLSDRLLEAALQGRFEFALQHFKTMVERQWDTLTPARRLRYRLVLFDAAATLTSVDELQLEYAVDLLTTLADSPDNDWQLLQANDRWQMIQRLATIGDGRFEMLELLAYVPDAGLRAFAVNQLMTAGLHQLDLGGDSRSFERLLHGIGATVDAYRLEEARKTRTATVRSPYPGQQPIDVRIPYRQLAIAGGSPRVHATAATLLGGYGISIVSIPSSNEAVRRERDIAQMLRGCDGVVLLVRQITHSTSDQVRKAAARLEIPVIFSNALSATALERHLLER